MTRPVWQRYVLDWILLGFIIFGLRLFDLDVFLTADEPLFLDHAREFAAGLATGNFGQMLGIGYPGVTVAGWAAPLVGLSPDEMGAYTIGRLATATLTGLLLLLIYGLGRRLLGHGPAFIGVALLALDPYSLAYARLFHIAAPLALLMTLAAITFLLWLREVRYRWLFLAGLFTGLALLTKSTALLLGPMLGLAAIGWAIAAGQWRRPGWWLNVAIAFLVITVTAAIVFIGLWPAMWVDPGAALGLTFGKLFVDQEAGTGNFGLFWWGRFVQDPGPFFYPVVFLLKSTPWLLVGLLLGLVQMATGSSGHNTRKQDANPVLVALWLFSLTYLILMTIASKKSVRYLLPAFPVFYLIVGHAYYQTFTWLRDKRLSQHPFRVATPLLAGLLTLLIFFALFYHPYYLTYYNPLLLGWRWAPQTLLIGWGEGLDGAARYLNDRPGGDVSAWYEWLFPLLYQGQVSAVVPQENLITADRTVLYINQVQRDIPSPQIIHYFRTRRQPEHTVNLAGIEYAWVYPGPIAGFQPDSAPQFPVNADFGGEARLVGYDAQPQPATGGHPLIVTLYWRTLQTPAADRFVYLRLVDRFGNIWASADSPPVMGLWPTTRWQPDMLVEDAHELIIPPGTPPGAYHLEVGLYDPDSGQTLYAAGRPVGRGGGLLIGDVAIAWESLASAEPDLPIITDTALAANVHLIGYNDLPDSATVGDFIDIDLVWREAASFFQFGSSPEYAIGFSWIREGQSLTVQPDTFPMPVDEWGRKAILRSRHQVIVPPTLEDGRYNLHIALLSTSEPAGPSLRLGTIDVADVPHQFKLPAEAKTPLGPAQLEVDPNTSIMMAGYRLEQVDQVLELHLYWEPDALVSSRYKVFAQLLDSDNVLVAQSDSVPAGGLRPTTGWLPDEVIVDPHLLNLPADLQPHAYRLVAGLYDPITGQRLRLRSGDAPLYPDAIFVARIIIEGK